MTMKKRMTNSMWLLRLNDMRSSKIENLQNVCVAESKEELESFLKSQEAEPYNDTGSNSIHGNSYTYRKSYKKGGPLEWYNKPYDFQIEKHLFSMESYTKYCEQLRDTAICSDNSPEMDARIRDNFINNIRHAELIFKNTIPLRLLVTNEQS